MLKTDRIRNIGIIAHIDAGKTTLSEHVIFYTGKGHQIGMVDEGTATMDWMPEEQEKGITITSAATTCEWNRTHINLIDTPGHVDFTAEVERSLRVLDGAIGVFDGVKGVEAQSETVWKQADRYRVPRLVFINKLDRPGASFDKSIEAIRTKLKGRTVTFTLPWFEGDRLAGVIDALERTLLEFNPGREGADIRRKPVPDGAARQVDAARDALLEAAAEADDSVMRWYLDRAGAEPSPDDLRRALRKGVVAGSFVPVFAGSALHHVGVQPLLDAVVHYLPSPLDLPPVAGRDPEEDEKEPPRLRRKPLPGEPFSALAFKTVHDRHGELTYLRIYSGVLKESDQLFNPRTGKRERINRLYRMHANHRESVPEAGPGEIVAAIGFRFTATGDTLCEKSHPIVYEAMVFRMIVHAFFMRSPASSNRPCGERARPVRSAAPAGGSVRPSPEPGSGT